MYKQIMLLIKFEFIFFVILEISYIFYFVAIYFTIDKMIKS